MRSSSAFDIPVKFEFDTAARDAVITILCKIVISFPQVSGIDTLVSISQHKYAALHLDMCFLSILRLQNSPMNRNYAFENPRSQSMSSNESAS